MRYLILVSIVSCSACSSYPQNRSFSQRTSTAAVSEDANEQVAAQENVDSQIDAIKAEEVAVLMPEAPAPSTPAEATPEASTPVVAVDMKTQVQDTFAQNEKLTAEQSAKLSASSLALIDAAQAGDKAAVLNLANKLVKQAVQVKGLFGFGLVDVAGIIAAVMDLIAAAVNLDVAGILAAVQDLIAAIV